MMPGCARIVAVANTLASTSKRWSTKCYLGLGSRTKKGVKMKTVSAVE